MQKKEIEEDKQETLFLYADILGFKEILKYKREIIPEIFNIFNKNPVYDEKNNILEFHAFMFSDTFVIYDLKYNNKVSVQIDSVIKLIWHLKIELSKINVFIRAQLRYGDFVYLPLSHLNAFYGDILVKADQDEKEIQSIGLFIDDKIKDEKNNFDDVMIPTKENEGNIYFVYDCHELKSFYNAVKSNIYKNNGKLFPTKYQNICGPYKDAIIDEINYIKKIYIEKLNEDLKPEVQKKYISTWNLYYQKFPGLLDYLVTNEFNLKSLCVEKEWDIIVDNSEK